jgi:hypothetical protein
MALTAETYVVRQPDKLSSLNDIWGTTLALGLSTSNSSIIGVGSSNFKYYTQVVAYDSNLEEINLGVFQYPPRPIDTSPYPNGYGAFSVSNPLRSFFQVDLNNFSITEPTISYSNIVPNYFTTLVNYGIASGFSYNPNLSVEAFEAVVGGFSFLGFSFSSISPFVNDSSGIIYIVSDNTFIQGSHILTSNGTTYSAITSTSFTSSMSSATPLATITNYSQADSSTNITELYGFDGTIDYHLYGVSYSFLIVDSSISDYIDGTTFKFLSNYPNRIDAPFCAEGEGAPCFNKAKRSRVDQYETITFVIDSVLLENITNVFYITYDKNYNSLDTFSFDLTAYLPCSSCGLFRADLPIGWNNLNSNFAVADDVEYLMVFIGDEFGSNPYTEFRTFRYDRECTIYEPKQFMFMNKLGAFEYFTFTQDTKQTHSISRNEYKKEVPWGDFQSRAWGYRGRSVMSGNVQKSFVANTNWITEVEYEFLAELVESPEVYVMEYYPQNSSYLPVPIIITDTSYEIKTSVRDSIFNLTINYKMAVDTPMQRQ